MQDFLDFFSTGSMGRGLASPESMLLILLLSFAMGQLVAWVYMWTHSGLSYSRMYVASLVVLPVIVSLVMSMMSNNLAVAFGLLAVFSVVRFRNSLKDTRDTAFVLWVIILGMACGLMLFSVAVMGCLFVGLVFLYLRVTHFGMRHRFDVVLNIQCGDSGASARLTPLFRRHFSRTILATERGDDQGGVDLSYRGLMRDPSRSSDLLSEIKSVEGVKFASLYMREDESEV